MASRPVVGGAGAACTVRAPGRVNLIGEHTDYNEGFVLPAAIDRFAWATAVAREGRRIVVHSENLRDTVTIDLDATGGEGEPRGHWSGYPRGVVRSLAAAGVRLRGAELRLSSDVPVGAGLSSSAALEVAIAHALLCVAGETLDPRRVAALCQRAEHEFVGTRCGIMDQMIACLGRAGHALLLDCRSLEASAIALPAEVKLVLCNSRVAHQLAAGEYNLRRTQCEAGARALGPGESGAWALRDVTPELLESRRGRLDPVVFRRCRHVVGENLRVQALADALRRGDLGRVGPLMAASHASLRDDFEVSCPELDLLVAIAAPLEGVYGARMTGGGFGGCTVNLVHDAALGAFRHRIAREYARTTGRALEILVCEAAGGAEQVG